MEENNVRIEEIRNVVFGLEQYGAGYKTPKDKITFAGAIPSTRAMRSRECSTTAVEYVEK